MYINLVLGAVALIVVWLYLKKLLVKDDTLSESPARLLEKELARRREQEEEKSKAFERLRDLSVVRMRAVLAALEELRAALPQEAQDALSWEDEEDRLIVSMRGVSAGDDPSASLEVSWRIPALDLRKAASVGDDFPGVYVVKRSDTAREESLSTLNGCMRYITSFIVDFVERGA